MSWVEFVQGWSVVTGILVVLAFVAYATGAGKFLDSRTDGAYGIVHVLGALIGVVLCVIFWIVTAVEHNNRTQDFNYCDSFIKRGHETMMLEYNYFNRDCMIKVDGQWLRLDDSAFGRNA